MIKKIFLAILLLLKSLAVQADPGPIANGTNGAAAFDQEPTTEDLETWGLPEQELEKAKKDLANLRQAPLPDTSANDEYIAQAWQAWQKAHPNDRPDNILDAIHAQFVAENRCVARSSDYMHTSPARSSNILSSPSQLRMVCGNTCACFALANAISSTEPGGYNPFEAEWLATKLFNTILLPANATPATFACLEQQHLDQIAGKQDESIKKLIREQNIIMVDINYIRLTTLNLQSQNTPLPQVFLSLISYMINAENELKNPSQQQEQKTAQEEAKNMEALLRKLFSSDANVIIDSCKQNRPTTPILGIYPAETTAQMFAKWCTLLQQGKGALIIAMQGHFACVAIDLSHQHPFIYRNSLQPFNPEPPQEMREFLASIQTLHKVIAAKAKPAGPSSPVILPPPPAPAQNPATPAAQPAGSTPAAAGAAEPTLLASLISNPWAGLGIGLAVVATIFYAAKKWLAPSKSKKMAATLRRTPIRRPAVARQSYAVGKLMP